MSGKSTYIRQVMLLQIVAQVSRFSYAVKSKETEVGRDWEQSANERRMLFPCGS